MLPRYPKSAVKRAARRAFAEISHQSNAAHSVRETLTAKGTSPRLPAIFSEVMIQQSRGIMVTITATETTPDWTALVCQIRSGDSSGTERLYQIVRDQTRARLNRRVEPQGAQDCLHDIFLTVLEAIHAGALREPARLMGFIKTVAQRCVSKHIRVQVARRVRFVAMGREEYSTQVEQSPDFAVAAASHAKSLRELLRCLRERDRNLLIRYYFLEQDPARICRAMKLSETQFRLFKSRALSRCAQVARRSRQPKFLRRLKPLLRHPKPQATDTEAASLKIQPLPCCMPPLLPAARQIAISLP